MSIRLRRLSLLVMLVFDLCVVAGDEDCDLPFSDAASRTVLADVVFRRPLPDSRGGPSPVVEPTYADVFQTVVVDLSLIHI